MHKIKSMFKRAVFAQNNKAVTDFDFLQNKIYIVEAIEYARKVTVHGILILDRSKDYNDITISIQNSDGAILDQKIHYLELTDFFDSNYDNDTKKAVGFSIRLDNMTSNFEIVAKKTGANNIIAKYYLGVAEINNLIIESHIYNPTFDQRLHLLNQAYEITRATNEILEGQKETKFKIQPKFSVIVPLYNTPENLFNEMYNSVVNQSYSNFELILVNASPGNIELKRLLTHAAKADSRVVTIELTSNEGIMKNTNTGINVATGNYVCFLDHDDVLEPDILFHYAKAINDKKGLADVLYCDDIILDENGHTAGTFLVGDFSIDALLHRNYIGHMLAIKKDILSKINTNTSEFDGAQDHYMVLMASLLTNNIVHVNRPLYQWRRTKSSTSANPASKSYATDAGIRAVQTYLDNAGIKGTVKEANRPFSYTINYEICSNSSITTIIDTTSSMRNINYTLDTIKTLLQGKVSEIYLIGSQANNEVLNARLNESNKIYYMNAKDKNDYAKKINSLVNEFKGKYLLFIDCNIYINNENQISVLLEKLQREDIGAVGPMLIYPDGTIASSGMAVSLPKPNNINRGLNVNDSGYMDFSECEQNYCAINGLSIMTRKSDFISVGGFSEDYIEYYFDVDYCLKLKKINKLITYTPTSRLTYYGDFLIKNIKNKTATMQELNDRVNLINNWKDLFADGDPYINSCFKNTENDAFCFIP